MSESTNKIPVQVVSSHEVWNTHLLEDGKILKIKHVLTWVKRVEGQTNQQGKAVYEFQGQLVVQVDEPLVSLPDGRVVGMDGQAFEPKLVK